MEFFATIGLFTVALFLYIVVLHFCTDFDPPSYRDPNRVPKRDKNIFYYDSSEDAFNTPLFELLPVTENPQGIQFNLQLEKIDSYVRLYQNLQNTYGKTVPADTFKKAPDLRLKVYETEILRRDISRELFEGKHSIFGNAETLTDDEQRKLTAATGALRSYATAIVRIYNTARKTCFASANLSKTAQLDRLYRVHDAEDQCFYNDPKLQASLAKSIDAAIKNIFKGPH